MLTNSKKIQKPSLIGVTTLQEAITVLNARKAPTIFTQAVDIKSVVFFFGVNFMNLDILLQFRNNA